MHVSADDSNSTTAWKDASLSLVIPAYNEADRLHLTLATAKCYLDAQSYPSELILVDDGSTDSTRQIAETFAAVHAGVHVLSIPHGGKAAALRAGLTAASGELVAFTDADLATPLEYLADLRAAIVHGFAVAIGSRESVGATRIGEPFHRHLMGRAFNTLVRAVVLPGIHDTQCGFKLFRGDAIREILSRARLYADSEQSITGPRVTAFDVELLVISRRLGYSIAEIPVIWTYGTQSKVSPLRDSFSNLCDVLTVKVNDLLRRYQRQIPAPITADSVPTARSVDSRLSVMPMLEEVAEYNVPTPPPRAVDRDQVGHTAAWLLDDGRTHRAH